MNIFQKIKTFWAYHITDPVEPSPEEPKGNVIDYLGALKLADLKAQAKSRGLKGYSKLRKAELLKYLREN
jgi:hypothetical protein